MGTSSLDIRDRAQQFALFEGGRRLLEALAHGVALASLLDDLCHLVEGVVGECSCSVLVVNAAAAQMEYGAAPSLPEGYTRSLVGRPALPAYGPCGMAVALREPVLVEDIAADERWAMQDWRGLALTYGLRACWSAPILSPSGAALGTFAIYWPAPARPGPEHEHVIHQMTYIAALAIERGRAAASLAGGERPAMQEKPSVREAVERVTQRAGLNVPTVDALIERYASLTPREREVLTWVVAGLPNKRIGGELGTAEITVKVHRGRVMQKMGAQSLAELVRMAARLDVPLPR
jgi:DNA-binding CsgD family transcriptional regulator